MIGEFHARKQDATSVQLDRWYGHTELHSFGYKVVDARGRRISRVRSARMSTGGVIVCVLHSCTEFNFVLRRSYDSPTGFDVVEFSAYVHGGRIEQA